MDRPQRPRLALSSFKCICKRLLMSISDCIYTGNRLLSLICPDREKPSGCGLAALLTCKWTNGYEYMGFLGDWVWWLSRLGNTLIQHLSAKSRLTRNFVSPPM